VIDGCSAQWDGEISLFAVDDGSTGLTFPSKAEIGKPKNLKQIKVLSLVCNLGHQRAIAVGLVEAFRYEEFDAVIVMDCDGEDQPEDIERLLMAFRCNPHSLIVAQRGKRSETSTFRIAYLLYKFAFTTLTGKTIDFGNFCLIPQTLLSRMVFMPDLWNHLAATIVKSRLPICKVKIHRGKRYAGTSKMNLVSLLIHGLSAISVYSDVVFVRIIVMSIFLSGLTALSILVVVLLRVFTSLAIPGWASYVVGLLCVLLLQTLLFAAGATFSLLSRRSILSIVPALDAQRYVRERITIFDF
ncbi:MAG TPA: glycosyltransferase, partial [Allocoleopsis sp.]